MRVVVALGGNALSKRGEELTAERQRASIRVAAKALAQLLDAGHEVVITHGNGPQVGYLAMQGGSFPLDVLGAETEGMIGYVLQQTIYNLNSGAQPVATLLTQVRVDADDPAFEKAAIFLRKCQNFIPGVEPTGHDIADRDGGFFFLPMPSPYLPPEWPRKRRVGANSPSLCPTMSSVT